MYPIVSQLNKCQVNISFPVYYIKTGSLSKTHISASKKIETGPVGPTVQELFKFESGNLFGTPFRDDECFEISDF